MLSVHGRLRWLKSGAKKMMAPEQHSHRGVGDPAAGAAWLPGTSMASDRATGFCSEPPILFHRGAGGPGSFSAPFCQWKATGISPRKREFDSRRAYHLFGRSEGPGGPSLHECGRVGCPRARRGARGSFQTNTRSTLTRAALLLPPMFPWPRGRHTRGPASGCCDFSSW